MTPCIRALWGDAVRLVGKLCALCGLLLFCLIAGLFFVQRVGAVGAVPAVDPVTRLNQKYQDVKPNAADVYAEALELLANTAPANWRGEAHQTEQAPAATIIDWVRQDNAVLSKLRAAAAVDRCYFAWARDEAGTFAGPTLDTAPLRDFVRLSWRVAEQTHDLELAEAVVEINSSLAGHWAQQPGFYSALRSAAHATFACNVMRAPFAWPDMPPSKLRSFADFARERFPVVASMNPGILEDREQMKWMCVAHANGLQWLTPHARLCGEIERWYQPYLELSDQPLEQLVSTTNELRNRIARQEQDRPSFGFSEVMNLSRAATEFMQPALLRGIDLQAQAATVRRGTEVLLKILVYQLEHGQLPDSLADLAGPLPDDPFARGAFHYRRDEGDFTLYSLAWDCDDDGGVHAPRFGLRTERTPEGYRQLPPDGDHVFWPIPPEK